MNWAFWALLSALFAGITAVLAKKGVATVDPNLAMAIRTSVVLVFSWLLFFLGRGSEPSTTLTRNNWLFLVLSGIATGLSWLCYFRALQAGPASRVAAVDKLSVVFVILFGIIFLGEHFKWMDWLAAGLIVSGALILALK